MTIVNPLRGRTPNATVHIAGDVAPGASADLLVFREDPTSDLAALDSLEAVIVRRRVLVRDDLVESVHRRRAEIDGATADAAAAARSFACH